MAICHRVSTHHPQMGTTGTQGFRSCHPITNSLQTLGRRKPLFVVIRTSVTSVGCSARGEEPGLPTEMGEGGGQGPLVRRGIGKKAFLILKV